MSYVCSGTDPKTETRQLVGWRRRSSCLRFRRRLIKSSQIDVDQYKYGFETVDIETDKAPKGLNEDIIRLISSKKEEPEWMLANGGLMPTSAG